LILIGNRSVGIWSLLPVLCWAVCCGSFHEWPFKCFHQPKTIDQLAKLGIDAPYGKLLPMRSLAIKYFNHLRIFWYCLLEDCWLVWLAVRRGLYVRPRHSGRSNLQIPSLIAVVGFFCWRINYGSFYIPLIFRVWKY
jgi:hypothetical protein